MNSLISKIIDGGILSNGGQQSGAQTNQGSSGGNLNSGILNTGGGGANGGATDANNNNAQSNKPKLKYKHWCVQLERKANGIAQGIPTLDQCFSSADEKKREKATSTLQKINTQFGELITLLEITSYKPSNKSNPDQQQQQQQQQLQADFNNLNLSGTVPATTVNSINVKQQQQQQQPPSPSPSPTSPSPIVNHINSSNLDSSNNNNSSNSNNSSSGLSSSTTIGGAGSASSPIAASTSTVITSSSSNTGSSQKNSSKAISSSARDSMLSVWGALIQFLEKYYKLDRDFSLFYQCILLICKRKEFDSSVTSIDPITFKPWSRASNDVLSKYKEKLYKTYYFIAISISNNNYLSIPLVGFCSKFLAVCYFRLPRVAKLIIEALTPPETEINDILSYFPTPQHLKHLNIIGDRPDKSPFHSILMQIPDSFSLETVGHGWVDNLARKELTFFIFFKEWFSNCKSDGLDLKQVPGFYPLTYSLLHELKTRDQCSPPLTKPTPAMEAHYVLINCCRSDGIIDTMIKTIFLKTCVFDLSAVSSTLGLVEVWLKEYGTLPDSFDINFFCEGMDSIISADHHQVLLRALQMLYNTSDCFQGNIRRILFSDLLLHKYFYHLFLHWDQPIRNAYHHILLYRMVRIKRSILYESGFSIAEYSKLTHNNTTPVTKQSLSPAKYIESKTNDHSYSSSSRLTNTSTSSIKPKSPRSTSSNNLLNQVPNQTNNNNNNNNNNNKKVPPPLPPRNFLAHSLDSSLDEDPIEEEMPQPPQRTKIIIPPSLEKFSKDYSIDIELFLEIELYIKKVSDQFRSPELRHHESRLTHYVASSLSEFKTYIAHNNQVDVTPPKIIPLMFANSPLNLANINANFRD